MSANIQLRGEFDTLVLFDSRSTMGKGRRWKIDLKSDKLFLFVISNTFQVFFGFM